jgi:hypothetical protein
MKNGFPSVSPCTVATRSGRRRNAGRHLDVARHVVAPESAEEVAARHRLARETAERLEQRMLARHLDVAVGADHEQAGRAHLASEELEEKERRLVRPVHVVEHEDERLADRRGLEEGGDAVEEPEARLLGLERRRRRQVGQSLAHVGHDLRDVGGARAHLGAHALRVAVVRYARMICTHGQ